MLSLKNCRVSEFREQVGTRPVIIFGAGSWFGHLMVGSLSFLELQCKYVIDNGDLDYVKLGNTIISVYKPDIIKKEKDCVVLITSPVYMYEMYIQLEQMKPEGEIDCYTLPFMSLIDETDNIPEMLVDEVINKDGKRKQLIPKVIHSFWFSGEKKSESYQRCIDSWKLLCPDYEIIEWNQDNYDCKANPFVKRAIELKAWAFATDFARLDVVYRYGGIYLDMDIELIKPLDDLLANNCVMNFCNNLSVDTCAFAAEKGNSLIKRVRETYFDVELPETKKGFNKFFPTSFEMQAISDSGVEFNGKLQKTEEAVFLPRTFFIPMDVVVFEFSAKTEYTHGIHYDNFGWSTGKENMRTKKIRDNRLLRNLIINSTDMS